MSYAEMDLLTDDEVRALSIKKNPYENATDEELLAQYILYERHGGIGSKHSCSIEEDYYDYVGDSFWYGNILEDVY